MTKFKNKDNKWVNNKKNIMENIIQSFSLNGKRSLVTGASKGIGASTAQILAEAGSDVVINGIYLEGLKETQ